MRFRSIAVITLLSFGAMGSARAQTGGRAAHPSCTGVAGDACQQAVDFFHYMAPQLGTAMTGGNTTMGQGGSMGGPRFGLVPRFSIGVRANAVIGHVPVYDPNVRLPGDPTPAARELTAESNYIPLPAVDLALGVFKGLPLALSNVGGIDLLLSAAYVPKYESDELNITPDKSLEFGYGVRVGLLQESLIVPGIGVSYMVRKFPVTTLSTVQGSASLSIDDLDLQSNAWRITASKSLLLFGISGGIGQDTYKASTSVTATQTPATVGPIELESKVTRTNYFGELSMNLMVLKIVGSVGMVSGGDITTYNTYETPADKSRMYGSVGVRIGL
jgi:hypothetical protein